MAFPPGLLLNRNTGVISGTPEEAGSFDFTLRVTDALGVSREIPTSFLVNNYTPLSWSGSLAIAAINQVYSSGFVRSGGVAAYVYTIFAGALPTGLSLNAGTGVISGTPTVAGTYNFTVRVTDGAGAHADQAGTIVVPVALAISGSAVDGSTGVAYSRTFSASGGTAPYSYSVFSGSIPPGLTLSASTGLLSGSPSSAAGYTFVIRVTDAYGTTNNSSSQAITIYSGPALPGSYARGTIGKVYSSTLTQVGGHAPVTYALLSGSLPSGLTLNASTCALTGTPTGSASTYTFVIRATDADGKTADSATQSVQIVAALALSGTLNSTITNGAPYSSNLSTSGGWTPLAWDISVGTLPAGLSINASSGVISGTPSGSGTSNFTVRCTDADGSVATSAQSLTVATSLAFTPNYNLSGTATRAYSSGTSATGGTAPLVYSKLSGTLPTGCSLSSSTGVISGTPTTAGTYTFVVRVTDNLGSAVDSISTAIVISAAPAFANAYPTKATLTVAYGGTASMTGGKAPITFALQAGALPTSLSLNASTGAITGTPTVAGAISYTIRATDANGATVDQVVTGTVAQYPTYSGTFLHGTDGTSYSQTLSAALGHTPYSYSKTGSLPTGLTLGSSSGTLSGTPTTPGTYVFTPTLTDAAGNDVSAASQSITIAATLSFGSVTLNSVIQGSAFSQTVAATGGWTPRTYNISVGSLPTGLSLTAGSGLISGTPSGSGSYSFTIRAVDNDGNIATKSFSGTIVTPVTTVINNNTVSGAGDRTTPSVGRAEYSIAANGTIGYYEGDDTIDSGTFSGEGVTVGAASDVEYRVTKTSGGALASGTLNVWRNWAANPDTYSLITGSTAKSCVLLVESRRASDLAALDSGTINMSVLA